ncbi:MAG: hypothetical protein H0W36_09725, partial [Gemmatimonadetes bacterium]|nr:hypothetical protein [Gemmatimonadota bacterium]
MGVAVSQTVFRFRDRQVLSQFFDQRLRSLEGFDPLRRLRRWSGRHQLTGHALRLLADEQVEDRVRAAIKSAFRAWDGSELIETPRGFGRLWPATVRLLPYPTPRLHLAAGNTKPLELTWQGTATVLEPGAEIQLPWTVLDAARGRSVQLGDATSEVGALRVPALGETLLFELGDDGLVRVDQPSEETVWVLTNSAALQQQASRRRFNDRGALPGPWQLFRDVPLSELPDVERATAPTTQEALRLTGGLLLARGIYLSGFAPLLEAGELDLGEDERLAVTVNGEPAGTIASGERLSLIAATPGTYRVAVGEGEFGASYDVEPRGTRLGFGSLRQHLD